MSKTKSEPAYKIDARRKRQQLYDFYAERGAPPQKVADLLGVDLMEAARELQRRKPEVSA